MAQVHGFQGRTIQASNMVMAGYAIQYEVVTTKTIQVGVGTTDGTTRYLGHDDLAIVAIQPLGGDATVGTGSLLILDDKGSSIPGDPLSSTTPLSQDVEYWPGPHKTVKFSALTKVRLTLG